VLADRVSSAIADRFKIPPPPTIAARVAGSSQIAFSHFRNSEPKRGTSVPSNWEEAFVFNVPLIPAKYSRVSIDGKGQSVVQSPGQAYLFDLTRRNEVSLDAVYDSIRFHLPQTAIDEIAFDKGHRRIGGLHARDLGQEDFILYHLAQIVLPAIQDPAKVTAAFVDYIALALHDHVIHTYGGLARGSRVTGGLAPWQIRRASDRIEADLASDLSITALSRECGLSASHFARAFRVSLGMAPHQWIVKQRIARAKQLMSDSDESLVEIALICGFVDQSHLCRVFLRETGTSPAQWRRRYGTVQASA
jgi:AraC-like DNA-binding protein